MLFVKVRNNARSIEVPVSDPAATTLRSVLEDNDIDYSRGTTHLDGAPLQPGDLNRTFAEFGITDGKCFLANVAKLDNA